MGYRTLYVGWALLIVSCASSFAQTIDDAVVPRKTEIFVKIQRSLNSKTARTGDRFHGEVEVPVTVDDKIIIPKGSFIIGHVDVSKTGGRVKGKPEMKLLFDTVILPGGTTRDIRAVLSSAEGQKLDPTREDGTMQGQGGQAGEVAGTATKGAIPGAGIGAIAGGWKGAGIGGVAGAATGALIGLLKKGKQVQLPKGSSITIQLEDDIQFVKPGSRTAAN